MMKKLTLKKKIITVLSDNEMQSVNGGNTTSYGNCTGFACCAPQPDKPASEGTGVTCLMSCPPITPPPAPWPTPA